MSGIKIVLDSTAYIPDSWFAEFPDLFSVVPLTVLFGSCSMEDGLKNQTVFLERLKSAADFPTTSQPTPAAFEKVFRRLKEQGNDILGIFISKKLSGTMASAETAARQLNFPGIYLLDSACTAAGQALVIRKAALYIKEGLGIEEVVSRVKEDISRLRLIFVPQTLEYLKKGGRIGGASALLGTVLKIKPVLFLKEEVKVLDKVRTFKKAVNRMLADIPPGYQGLLGLVHIADLPAAEKLKADIADLFPQSEIFILEAGPVLATHAGPGALGISYFADQHH